MYLKVDCEQISAMRSKSTIHIVPYYTVALSNTFKWILGDETTKNVQIL